MISWSKLPKPMLNLSSRNKKDLMKKVNWLEVSLSIKEIRIKKNLKLKWRHKESRRRRKEKSRDLENFKKRLPIDKLKLMLLEPRELSRKVKDRLEKERDWSNKREKEFKLISKLQDKDNSQRSKEILPNKPELKERTTWTRSKSKSKSSNKKERLRRRRRKPSKTTHSKSEVKYTIRSKSKSKTDLTTLRKAERSERK